MEIIHFTDKEMRFQEIDLTQSHLMYGSIQKLVSNDSQCSVLLGELHSHQFTYVFFCLTKMSCRMPCCEGAASDLV